MSPMLLLPSVRRITTLLFALESFSLDTALASPMPKAVPSWISPRAAMSVRTLCSRLSSDVWSVVIGHWVKASPAKMVRPILSLGRPEMNSAATSLAASMRLGFKSSANIEVETSIANMMSMPSTCLCPQELWVWGRARMKTMSVNTTQRSSIGALTSRTRQLFGAFR